MDLSRNADEIVEWFSLAAFGKTAEVFLKPRMKGAGAWNSVLGEGAYSPFGSCIRLTPGRNAIGDSRLLSNE